MGRLMDAILAVSALVMASAVAWVDWVISCCGVCSDAMSQVLDGLIMVRLGKKTGGRIQKCLYLRNHWSGLLGQCIGEGVPYQEVALFSHQ